MDKLHRTQVRKVIESHIKQIVLVVSSFKIVTQVLIVLKQSGRG